MHRLVFFYLLPPPRFQLPLLQPSSTPSPFARVLLHLFPRVFVHLFLLSFSTSSSSLPSCHTPSAFFLLSVTPGTFSSCCLTTSPCFLDRSASTSACVLPFRRALSSLASTTSAPLYLFCRSVGSNYICTNNGVRSGHRLVCVGQCHFYSPLGTPS